MIITPLFGGPTLLIMTDGKTLHAQTELYILSFQIHESTLGIL